MMNASLVTAYDGVDKNNIVMDILGAGPLPWSISRFERGRFHPCIEPRHPYAQPNLGTPGGKDGFYTEDMKSFAVQAWSLSVQRGVLLATVAQNGQQWNDGSPRFYAAVVVAFNSQAYGYEMVNGAFTTDYSNMHVVVGKIGEQGTANIDVAIAWFPYDQGWMAGVIDEPLSEYSDPNRIQRGRAQWVMTYAHGNQLSEYADKSMIVRWSKNYATLRLPGVKPGSDGLLFLMSADNGTDGNVNGISAAIDEKDGGWKLQQWDDKQADVSESARLKELMFSFLFIPFTAGGLIGANVDGKNCRPKSKEQAKGKFKCTRLGTGQYEIVLPPFHPTISGEDFITERDGMLLLQATGREEGVKEEVMRRAFLSYNYSSQGTLIVEARRLQRLGGQESYPLVDTDFSFMWVDFLHPVTPTPDTFTGSQGVQQQESSFLFVVGLLLSLLIGGSVAALAFVSFRHILFPAGMTFTLHSASSMGLQLD